VSPGILGTLRRRQKNPRGIQISQGEGKPGLPDTGPEGAKGQESYRRVQRVKPGSKWRCIGTGTRLQGWFNSKVGAGLRKKTRGRASTRSQEWIILCGERQRESHRGREGNHERKITTKEQIARMTEGLSFRCQALEVQTLGVQAGWNKPASR